MSKQLNKKQLTHQRILAAASENFRSHGYAGIGVDGIAKTADVTSGAFYSHFGSKQKAFLSAIEAGLNEVIDGVSAFQQNHNEKWVEAFAEYYLGQKHRDDLACGCAMTSLSPEVVRSDSKIKLVYETKMEKIIEIMANGLTGDSEEERQNKSWTILGLLIGGLTITRAVDNQNKANAIADSVKAAVISISD